MSNLGPKVATVEWHPIRLPLGPIPRTLPLVKLPVEQLQVEDAIPKQIVCERAVSTFFSFFPDQE